MTAALDRFTAPEGETPLERTRRLARERKRRQRQNEALAKVRAEAVKFSADFFGGTVKALQRVIEAGGFTGAEAAEEAITLLLHGAADLADRDRHAFERLIAPPSRCERADD